MLLAIQPLVAQGESRVLSEGEGNFTLQGRLTIPEGKSATLRFRSKSGLGYRVQFGGAAPLRLDDPGRRSGVLAAALAAEPSGTFRLTANGPRLQLEWNGKPAWDYTENEAGVRLRGAVIFEAQRGVTVRDMDFQALPPTPESFAERYGPGLGEKAPAIRAVDQNGKLQDFASLRGPKGLLILFFRSADW